MTDIAINPVTRRVQFQGTTGTGPFAFSFNILQASDIAVLKNNVVLAIGTGATNYSVSINANGTGSVSLVTALISSDTLIIMGGRELSRTTDFVTAGDLLASSLNEQLDSNVVMSQQLDEKVDRSIIAQPGDKLVGVNLSLPLVADRANELIKFDASGNVTTVPVSEVVGTDIDTQKITIKTSAGATKLVINGNITDLITAADNLTIVSTSGDIDFKPGGGQINLLGSTGAQRMALDNTAQPTMQYFQASNVTKLGVVDPTATRTILLPDASDTLVGKATTDTLTNKTLASPVITGSLAVGTLTGSGDILLDAVGDIVLDAAGDQIFFKDGGTLRITFELGAAGTSMVSASELVMAVTSGGINFKPQTGNVDFLQNSGAQAVQINSAGSSTITYHQNSNTTKLGVVDPTASRVLLLPNASDTLVGLATTDTLTNKTLANPSFTGNLNFSGDVVIDSSGDITLDADGGEIFFKDDGATRLTFQVSAVAATLNSASDFNVNSAGDIGLKPAGGQVDILGTSGQQRIQFDNSISPTMKYYQNSNTTSLGVVDPTGARALLLPDASDTLVGKATTDTLTNKTLASPTITGSLDMSDVNITNVGSIALDRITNDGSGGITLDSSQGINYDAGTGQNLFKVNGQTRLTVALNSSAIQTITSLATLSITAGNDINLRPNGGQLYVLNNAGGDNFQFNTSSTPTLGIHQNSNVTNLGLVNPTATRTILFPDASDTLVGKATTDTLTNKTLTSPVLNTGVSGSAFLDEDNFASNSATKIASQQSIKAYVDAATAGGGAGSLSTVLGIGNTTGSNNVLFGDNNKAIFGAGSDLQIYHNGTHSLIDDAGQGDLRIRGDNISFRSTSTDEPYINLTTNGAVTLYYDSAAKLATTSTGVDVTGTLTSDGLTVDGVAKISSGSPTLRFTETDTTDVNTRITCGAGQFFIQSENDAENTRKDRFRLNHSTGDISFYEDTGSTPKFFWDASAEALGLGTTSPTADIHMVKADDINEIIMDANRPDAGQLIGRNRYYWNGTEVARIEGDAGSDTTNKDDGILRFLTKPSGSSIEETMRIDSSGNVGINVVPARKLHVGGTGSGQGELHLTNATTGHAQTDGSTFTTSGSDLLILQRENANITISTNGSERMRIDSSGNVTVGPPAFGANLGQLRIVSDAASTDATLSLFGYNNIADGANFAKIQFAMQTGGTGGQTVAQIAGAAEGTAENAADLVFSTATGGTLSERMRIDSSGGIRASSGSRFLASSTGVSTPDYSFASDGSMGMYRIPGALGFATGSTERMRISSTGLSTFIGANNGTNFTLTSATDNNYLALGAANNFGSNNNTQTKWTLRWRGRPNTGGHSLALVDEVNSATRLTVDAYGSFGFNNTTPSYKYDFYHDSSSTYMARFHHNGNNVNRYGIVISVGTDDNSGTNVHISFSDGDNTGVGSVSSSSGTVSYNAFSASHEVILPDADNAEGYPYGTLVETSSITYAQNSSGQDFERGIRYNVTKSSGANSKAVLGAYSGKITHETNLHFAYILGDGHILCNNSGGNIAVGDGICTSSTAGIGQKATVNPSMIIGIAQEAITFDNTENKLVAVQYGLQQFTPWP